MDSVYWDKVWSRKYERYNRHHRQIWEAMIPMLAGNVVDLGCGPCVMYEGKQLGLIGIDWSAEALKQARLHYPYGIYLQRDIKDTGLPAGQFDFVVALGVLDYYSDWGVILKEARRLVKENGKIYATLLNGFQGHDWSNYKHICEDWHLAEF